MVASYRQAFIILLSISTPSSAIIIIAVIKMFVIVKVIVIITVIIINPRVWIRCRKQTPYFSFFIFSYPARVGRQRC